MADVPAYGDARYLHDELMMGSGKKGATLNYRCHGRMWSAVAGAVFALLMSIPAQAHNGPPFPIIEHKTVGPYVVSLWTHPDIGTGTFFVIVDPVLGGKIPSDLKVQIGVQPESGRLPEKVYDTWRDKVRDHVQFDNQVDFDQQDYFRIRLILQSSAGDGEALSRVEATPTGLGKWDLLFYASPFLIVVIMWYRGMSKRRKRVKKKMANATSGVTTGVPASVNERAKF